MHMAKMHVTHCLLCHGYALTCLYISYLHECIHVGGAYARYMSFQSFTCCSLYLYLKLWCMLPSITKKGEIESATNPRVVLAINNNIYIIELIFTWESFQRSSMIWVWKCLKKWTPQNAKTSIGKSSRLYFWFSDQRSHWVHRKSQYY